MELHKLSSGFMIRHKIWGGFGIVLMILMLISGSSLSILSTVDQSVSTVVDQNQPLVLASTRLAEHIARANGFLGFYLLSHEEQHKNAYLQALKQINQDIEQLRSSTPAELKTKVNDIITLIEKFTQYKDKFIHLPNNRAENFPAFSFASEHLNPIAISNAQIMTSMIDSEKEEEISEERQQLGYNLNNLRYQWARVLSDIRNYMNTGMTATKEDLLANLEQLPVIIKNLEADSDLFTLEQEEGIPEVKAAIARYTEQIAGIVKIQESPKKRTDAYLIESQLGPLVNNIEDNLGALVVNQTSAIQKNSQTLLEDVRSGMKIEWVLLSLGLLLGIIAAWVISRNISSQLNTTVSALQELAEGDGDLTQRLEVKGNDEIALLSSAFNRFAEKMASLVGEVAASTTRLTTAANQLNSLSSQTLEAASQQSHQVNSIHDTMNNIAQQVDDITNRTSEATQIAQSTDVESSNGKQVVEQGIAATEQLDKDISSATQTVADLEKHAESIGGVLDVIQGIAEQTNLLALNAAIEAARAGEQGRGFAVVADEVRTLASRTQDSTQEIQKIIEAFQNGTKTAVNGMQHGSLQVKRVVDFTQQLDGALSSIASSVSRMHEMNVKITDTTEQHAQMSDNVTQSINSVATLSTQVSNDAHQLNNTGQEISELSNQLEALVGSFKY